MGGFPHTPQVMRGALVGLDLLSPLSSVVIFQYNPSTMRRRLRPQGVQAQGAHSEALRLAGPPIETIDMDIELDAIDRTLSGDEEAATVGIYPQLAALEMLVTPKLYQVVGSMAMMAAGSLWVVPPKAPLTVLIWGALRVLPVRVEEINVNEQQYDSDLNPVRASVGLELRVLTYDDLKPTNPGFGVSLAHQAVQEGLAAIGALDALNGLTGGGAP